MLYFNLFRDLRQKNLARVDQLQITRGTCTLSQTVVGTLFLADYTLLYYLTGFELWSVAVKLFPGAVSCSPSLNVVSVKLWEVEGKVLELGLGWA